MSLEYITQKIIDEASDYADDVIEKAKEEARTTSEEYESLAEKEYNQIIDSAYEKANEVLNRATAQGVKEKRINIISAKWEYLDNAFSSAIKLMCKLPNEKQVRFIAGLVQKYQRSEAELIFNSVDRDRLGSDVVAAVNKAPGSFKVRLSDTVGDFSGGVILKEKSVEANLTYDAIIASERERLEEEVSAILFKETEVPGV